MTFKKIILLLSTCCTLLLAYVAITAQKRTHENIDKRIIDYTIDPAISNLAFYWKDNKGSILHNIASLKTFIESHHEQLLFAMNGGMFLNDYSPQGLYIENYQTLKQLDTTSGQGNFYLKPNGVFYLNKNNKANICTVTDFNPSKNVKFATQSGPMLVINSQLHKAFKQGSENVHIRNGVGILPSGKLIFAISKVPVNFYDFATYFKQAGCTQALYLDGFVSRMYLPEKKVMMPEGNFGVMIAVTKKNN
ncbi:MAG: phosphodiester glycosidase family protein [Chitinophagaceae bacterium]|nr:phosphodiester glycosidase family protein [Chitinophagaceae bacterium]